MELINTARALEDKDFSWRVRAACILHASKNVPAYFQARQTNPKPYYYAMHVLMFPDTVDPSMKAFVAVDSAVAAKVTVDGGAISTEAVDDTDIIRVVDAQWDEVSIKYNTDPSVINRVPQGTGSGL